MSAALRQWLLEYRDWFNIWRIILFLRVLENHKTDFYFNLHEKALLAYLKSLNRPSESLINNICVLSTYGGTALKSIQSRKVQFMVEDWGITGLGSRASEWEAEVCLIKMSKCNNAIWSNSRQSSTGPPKKWTSSLWRQKVLKIIHPDPDLCDTESTF